MARGKAVVKVSTKADAMARKLNRGAKAYVRKLQKGMK